MENQGNDGLLDVNSNYYHYIIHCTWMGKFLFSADWQQCIKEAVLSIRKWVRQNCNAQFSNEIFFFFSVIFQIKIKWRNEEEGQEPLQVMIKDPFFLPPIWTKMVSSLFIFCYHSKINLQLPVSLKFPFIEFNKYSAGGQRSPIPKFFPNYLTSWKQNALPIINFKSINNHSVNVTSHSPNLNLMNGNFSEMGIGLTEWEM